MRVALLAATVALTACSTTPAPAPVRPPTAGLIRTVSYETGPCFGACPVYSLTVRSDGTGTFIGKQHTAVSGTRAFALTAGQFAAFEARLAPYRPAGERRLAMGQECNGRVATDMQSVEVSWAGKGPPSKLHAYYGCDHERNAAMFEALRTAPQVVPQLDELIGRR